MSIAPVTSVTNLSPSQPLSARPPLQQGSALSKTGSILSIQDGTASTSNIATLSFLQGLVGYASAQAILNATVSYQQTSVYGSGMTPRGLSISDQIAELYRQIAADQTRLVDQLEADANAAAKALAEGDIWGFLTSSWDVLTDTAKAIGNAILGVFKMVAGVISIFFTACFSPWFRAAEDAQSALYIGGPDDPKNVLTSDIAIKGLLPNVDPVKDIPEENAAVNEYAAETQLTRDPQAVRTQANAPVVSTTEATADSAESIPGWLPGYVSPEQILDENSVKQILREAIQETKEALVRANEIRGAFSEVLDLAAQQVAFARVAAESGKVTRPPTPGEDRQT